MSMPPIKAISVAIPPVIVKRDSVAGRGRYNKRTTEHPPIQTKYSPVSLSVGLSQELINTSDATVESPRSKNTVTVHIAPTEYSRVVNSIPVIGSNRRASDIPKEATSRHKIPTNIERIANTMVRNVFMIVVFRNPVPGFKLVLIQNNVVFDQDDCFPK